MYDDATLGWILGLYSVCFLFGYVMPSLIAFGRGHPQRVPIMAANIFLGWTFFIWVALLVYAFWRIPEHDRV